MKETFASCGDPLIQKQLGYLLARQGEERSLRTLKSYALRLNLF